MKKWILLFTVILVCFVVFLTYSALAPNRILKMGLGVDIPAFKFGHLEKQEWGSSGGYSVWSFDMPLSENDSCAHGLRPFSGASYSVTEINRLMAGDRIKCSAEMSRDGEQFIAVQSDKKLVFYYYSN